MNPIAGRAERIAATLVSGILGGRITHFDVDGRQNVVDFHIALGDGTLVALEVTLIADRRVLQWDDLTLKDDRVWPAQTAWEYRPLGYRSCYRKVRAAAIRLAQLCDDAGVDSWTDLRPATREEQVALWHLVEELSGDLTRNRFRQEPGIRLFSATTVELIDHDGPDLIDLLEDWLEHPHVQPHLAKVRRDHEASEHHLFLVPVGDILPSRFFTDDFPEPSRIPHGYDGLDSLWLWSDYWHRVLRLHNNAWEWVAFPTPANAPPPGASS